MIDDATIYAILNTPDSYEQPMSAIAVYLYKNIN